MKKGKVFFHPIEGAGALTISWSSGPKGDAVEAKKGAGVGFFADSGELLCVIFDEVETLEDHQILEFDRYRVEIFLKNGKATFSVSDAKSKSLSLKKHARKKQPKSTKIKRQSVSKTRTLLQS